MTYPLESASFPHRLLTFPDRAAAGQMLAEHLGDVVTPSSIVAALSRGGVAVALPISERFGVPLAVTYVSKLAAARAAEHVRSPTS